MSRSDRLPSLNALAVFEVAARHGGFSSAAEELGVTPAAVSHQVKSLEAELDYSLFDRRPHGVTLTGAGAKLALGVRQGLDRIAASVDELRPAEGSVTIQATTAVSSLWLTPRLGRFWRSEPDVRVTQIVTDDDRRSSRADLQIRYGDPELDEADTVGSTRTLFADRIVVAAAPALAAEYRNRNVGAIRDAPLVHLEIPGTRWTSWEAWAASFGITEPLDSSMTVDNYTIALQAALDGVGLVLGWAHLIAPKLQTGELERVFVETMPAPHPFYIWIRERPSIEIERLAEFLSTGVEPVH